MNSRFNGSKYIKLPEFGLFLSVVDVKDTHTFFAYLCNQYFRNKQQKVRSNKKRLKANKNEKTPMKNQKKIEYRKDYEIMRNTRKEKEKNYR